jgi:hypothetical protein
MWCVTSGQCPGIGLREDEDDTGVATLADGTLGFLAVAASLADADVPAPRRLESGAGILTSCRKGALLWRRTGQDTRTDLLQRTRGFRL